ncbi:4Fe-4S binding protein [Acidaminococcus intestini]|nr:4Fe-4S binding protein [Acidaminococcus intestini]
MDAARCVKCGLCVRLCPVGNLSLGMDAVHMGKTCTYCLACLHACPKQAITIRERHILKEDQYHHPNVPFTGR